MTVILHAADLNNYLPVILAGAQNGVHHRRDGLSRCCFRPTLHIQQNIKEILKSQLWLYVTACFTSFFAFLCISPVSTRLRPFDDGHHCNSIVLRDFSGC